VTTWALSSGICDVLILQTFRNIGVNVMNSRRYFLATFRPPSNWLRAKGRAIDKPHLRGCLSASCCLQLLASTSVCICHSFSSSKQANDFVFCLDLIRKIYHDIHWITLIYQIWKTKLPDATRLFSLDPRRSSVGRVVRSRCCSMPWTSVVTTPSMRPQMQGWDKDGQRWTKLKWIVLYHLGKL